MFRKALSRTVRPKNLFLLFVGVALLAGCSGNLRMSKRKSRLMVPAGVDSTVAARADSAADRLFVSIEREKRAEAYKSLGKKRTTRSDTLWKVLSNELDPSHKVTAEDSLRAIEAFNAGARNLQRVAQLDQQGGDELARSARQAEIQRLLQEARKNFERALVLNPFDAETKSWLARVYQSLAVRFLDQDNHKKAVKVLENLVRLEKGEHSLFARLAESYYALEEWQLAHDNFVRAEQVLRAAAGLDFDTENAFAETQVDTSTLFYYVYYQGDTEIKMHRAEAGLHDLRRALSYATTEKERSDIHSYIEWINWDDGNTRAVELRDRYLALQEQGKYREAAKGFLKLIPMLKTRRAIDETVWRLAVLEFQYLNRKNEGIERLKHVVQLADKDTRGAPVDSTYRRYFDSYGVMCHNLGLDYTRKNRKVAFMYFQQAVAIAWESRAKSYLELAKLSRNNPRLVIENCSKALAGSAQLDGNEQMQAYQLIVQALKRTGQFDRARTYYAQWVNLRKTNSRSARR
ncbi:MAG: hypothetical protein D6743_02520 [Calditrichaeota bacterium]|nr:MAG: hypothetical protein D6743_02520 [Calditrichota bacterium]